MKCCAWINQVITKGSVAIKVNDDVRHYFKTRKGVRQGDPLSPILFNIVVDMLAILIERAKENQQFKGVVPHLIDDGLSILQYADDTILFMEHNLEQAKNLKLLLCAFEQLSGLKINFHKSELFCFGEAQAVQMEYEQIFGCSQGMFPFRYLGIPMHYRRLQNSVWKRVDERFQNRLSGWKGKLLSAGGKLVLINSVLSSLPLFMFSFFEVPREVLKKLDFYRSRFFFWQSNEHKKKYRLTRWSVLCCSKDQGGLGILNLDAQNKCLLSKWLFKLINEQGMWQTLLRRKYLRYISLTQVEHLPGDSHFWLGLMSVKSELLRRGKFKLGNRSQIRFWEESWLDNEPLKNQYPTLYNIARKKICVSQPCSKLDSTKCLFS